MKEEHERLIKDWFRRARESQHVHYSCGNYFSKLNYFLGIPTIILGAIVGTAIFSSLDNQSVGDYTVLIGSVSILSSVLATLHTFLGFEQRAAKHKLTASGYSSIRRELELLKSFPIDDEEKLSSKLETVKVSLDHLADASPEVPKFMWSKSAHSLKDEEHHRIFKLNT